MRFHLIGIGGTGMGALAGLLKAAGHDVRGSDTAVYPPMSDQLAALDIPVMQPFAPDNLGWGPEKVVVGNVCSRDHLEVVEAQRLGLPLVSLPSLLGDEFLESRHSIVIAGTHGKTTTTSILSHLLVSAGRDPSCFIGGVPIGLGKGWRLGAGPDFVVEGDEYDSAFFDKGSKFLHYRPKTALLTSVELDHVDIFSSMNAVRETFRAFVRLIPADGYLLVAADSREATTIAGSEAKCRVETYGVADSEEVVEGEVRPHWVATNATYLESGRRRFDVFCKGQYMDTYETILSGNHNLCNVLASIAIARSLDVPAGEIRAGVASFAGVKRRQEIRGVAQGVTVIDDYAHHPTAVSRTLQALQQRFRGRRLVAIYEPRSATSRRKTFQDEFATAFSHADAMIIGRLFHPDKIPKEERFSPEKLAADLHQSGTQAKFIEDVGNIVAHTVELVRPGDVVVVFSSGSFDGLHDRLLRALGDAIMPARRSDEADIRSLLETEKLDVSALDFEDVENFFVLRNETGFVGCIALEVFGEDGILRSLAVTQSARGGGYGWMLADTVVTSARARGVKRIYLLTETASDFFAAKLGFRIVDLSTVAAKVAASKTFKSLADRGPTAMRLDL